MIRQKRHHSSVATLLKWIEGRDMKKYCRPLLFATFFSLAFIGYGHPGNIDPMGGHYNRKTGQYHYHPERTRVPVPSPKRGPKGVPANDTQEAVQSTYNTQIVPTTEKVSKTVPSSNGTRKTKPSSKSVKASPLPSKGKLPQKASSTVRTKATDSSSTTQTVSADNSVLIKQLEIAQKNIPTTITQFNITTFSLTLKDEMKLRKNSSDSGETPITKVVLREFDKCTCFNFTKEDIENETDVNIASAMRHMTKAGQLYKRYIEERKDFLFDFAVTNHRNAYKSLAKAFPSQKILFDLWLYECQIKAEKAKQ